MSNRTESTRKAVTRFWNRSREYYRLAAEANAELAPERQLLFSFLEGSELVLDLGCGSCENSLWLPGGCRYVGLDLSSVALILAQEQARPALLVRGDGGQLPFATESVDVVLTTWVIEHLHDPPGTLIEAARVLRPGGLMMMLCSTWDLPYAVPPSLAPGRRVATTLHRLTHTLRSVLDGRHRFELVRDPRLLTEGYVPDADAVHITHSFFLRRFLESVGLEILEHRVLPHGNATAGVRRLWRRVARRLPIWSHGWGNVLLVARRGRRFRAPDYELHYR